jgi:hypothetical protein
MELLSRLQKVIADYSKREEQLTKDLGKTRHVTGRQHRETLQQFEARVAERIQETEAFLDAEEERFRTVHDGRRAWIHRAHTSCIKNVLAKARHAKEREIGDLQFRHLQAQRSLPQKLKEADVAFTEFLAQVVEQRAILTTLEQRAQRVFAGSAAFLQMLRARPAQERPTELPDHRDIYRTLAATLGEAEQQLAAFRLLVLPKFFSLVQLPIVILVVGIAGAVLAFALGFTPIALSIAGGAAALLVGIAFLLHRISMGRAQPLAESISRSLADARQLHDLCGVAAQAFHDQERRRIQQEFEYLCAEIEAHWSHAGDAERELSRETRGKVEEQVPRVLARNNRQLERRLEWLKSERTSRVAKLKSDAEEEKRRLVASYEETFSTDVADEKSRWSSLESGWKQELSAIYRSVAEMNAAAAETLPKWSSEFAESWQPPQEFPTIARFGRLELDVTQLPLPKDPRLALPGPSQISLPLVLTFPGQASLLFETKDSGNSAVVDTLNNVMLHLLAVTPPGKLAFTIVDPVGLGQNFAGFMHLGDYEESLINRRIWTQRDQIEERLAELNEHIEKVIQMYLRDEFANITEYNAQAGSVAEKYHFLVIADFPSNFGETAARRLQSIATSGPRCGVYTLIHWDTRQPVPDGFVAEDLRKNSICLRRSGNEFILHAEQLSHGARLIFDAPPDPDVAARLIHKIGKSSIDSNRVEVPFSQIVPPPAERWANDTTSELRIPIGRTGATKLQYLAIGKGTRQHALFAGKTGSGKSTLFHVIITNLALACSPEQVEFYLIDFKKGVEFKCYATKRLPHARVVAIESDREFGLSVLQRVDEELKRRGDLFRRLGVQDVSGYKKAGGTEPIPRTLLMIDEFQEFFVEDDSIAQNASLLFDRIVRQGRAFGIHVLLGSQTLGGAFTLARATMGQMVIRVALQCNEADAYLIMDDNNAAPRLLSRPGEGIYNDAAGAIEGNSPFQVVWLADQERDAWLDEVHRLAEVRGNGHAAPIVFEGNAPADIRENNLLHAVLAKAPAAAPPGARCWLGAPNSIKGPTEVIFHRQSGNHLLVVGQRDEAALAMLGFSLVALAAQHPLDTARFVVLHSANPGSQEASFIEQIAAAIPHEIKLVRPQDIGEVMNELAAELKARSADGEARQWTARLLFRARPAALQKTSTGGRVCL